MREMPGVHIDQNRCSHKSECAEITRAYKKAKKAIRDRSATDVVMPNKATMPTSEMELRINKIEEENKCLKAKLDEYDQRFSRWLFNATATGIDIARLDQLIPPSLDAAIRKRNALK